MALALKFFGTTTLGAAAADIRTASGTECYKRVFVMNPTGAAITINLYTNDGGAGDRQFGDKDYSLAANESRDWGLCILENGDKLRGSGNGALVSLFGFTE